MLHALCDALLGAAGLGDIGEHFSDQDQQYANISSRTLLKKTMALLAHAKLKLVNADVTIVAQAPKLSAYKSLMRSNIAEDCQVSTDDINIKATTTEGLGAMGRKEGIAVHAVVLLEEV